MIKSVVVKESFYYGSIIMWWLSVYIASHKCINPFPNKPRFLCVCSTSLLKTLWVKEKLLVTSNFSFAQCFLPVWITVYHFHQIWNCRLQTLSVWRKLKFVVWGRIKPPFHCASLTCWKLKPWILWLGFYYMLLFIISVSQGNSDRR